MIHTIKTDEKSFPLPLVVRFINGVMWELMEPFEYHRKNGEVIRVPVGFKFDFASIPRIFWSWIGSPIGKYGPAAVIHDYMCVNPFPKKEADSVFLEAMKVLKVPAWKRTIMYLAVRLFHTLKIGAKR